MFKRIIFSLLKEIGYLFYPNKKEVVDFNPLAAVKYAIFQKILNLNGSRNIEWPVHFTSVVGSNIKCGYFSSPGYMPGIYINTINGVIIGDNVLIGPGVKIISANHDKRDYKKHVKAPPIIIGNNVWIGANAVILPGVKIADGCIIGAGAVVTKSFLEENCIIAGNPAKIIRRKFTE